MTSNLGCQVKLNMFSKQTYGVKYLIRVGKQVKNVPKHLTSYASAPSHLYSQTTEAFGLMLLINFPVASQESHGTRILNVQGRRKWNSGVAGAICFTGKRTGLQKKSTPSRLSEISMKNHLTFIHNKYILYTS